MTILSNFYPDFYQWSLFQGNRRFPSTDPYRFYQWDDSSLDEIFNSRNTSSIGRRNVVSIPIKREGSESSHLRSSHYLEVDDSEWESDWDSDSSDDSNYNSLPMRRKRRFETNTLSNRSDLPIRVEDDSHSPSPSKQKFEESNSNNLEKVSNDSVTKRYRTRASETDKNVVFVDDGIECEINELTNYDVYKHLKTLLQKYGRCIDEMRGDGNCFFRALSKVVYGNQRFYNDIRQAVVDLIAKYPKKFEAVTDGPVSSHIEAMREDKTWATQTEIYAAATLLGRPIYILSPDQRGENYKWLLFSQLFKCHTGKLDDACYITICHTHGNHYDRVAPIKGKCNCELDPPELCGIKDSVDLTVDEDEIV